MRISIAMATFNGASYLPQQLESLAAQSLLPDELVVSDDNSSDETRDIVLSFADDAPFEVRLLQNDENVGCVENFNRAILACSGDLVFLCDQDDTWYSNKIAAMVEIANEDPDQWLIINDAEIADESLSPKGVTKLGQIRSAGLADSVFIMGCCCVLRRDLIELCMPVPNGYWAHDKWIVKFSEGVGRKRIVEQVLQLYRRHGANESTYITSQTSKVGLWTLLLYEWKGAMSRKRRQTQSDIEESLNQLILFREGVKRALDRANDSLTIEIERFLQQVDEDFSRQRFRTLLRQKSFPFRSLSVIKYWLSGHYRKEAGFKSALRDLMG